MDFLPQWASDLSGWGLVAIAFLMLITGKGLATRREVDAAEKRAETYRIAMETAVAALREKAEHDGKREKREDELIENSRTTVRVLEVLQAAREEQVRRLAIVPDEHPPGTEATS